MKLILWGATGQAKVLRELAAGYEVIAVFDNQKVAPPFQDVPCVHGWDGFLAWRRTQPGVVHFIVAIGGNKGQQRLAMHDELKAAGLVPASAIHKTAFVANNASIGEGCQVLANAAVCVEARLGRSCIVNTAASVDHECKLGDGVHIAPGAHLAGLVTVGDFSMIGTGATVLPNITIGRNCMIGAGAVVTKDMPENTVAYGNPAHRSDRGNSHG